MEADRTLDEIMELMQLADAEATRGGRLHKAGSKVKADTLAEHHEKMAEFYAGVADRHAAIADGYSTGGKLNKRADPTDKDDEGKGEGEGGDGGEGGEGGSFGKQAYGALETIRSRMTKRNVPITRAALAEMFAEHDKNFLATLVKVFRAPVQDEDGASVQDQAAIDHLRQLGYTVEDPSLSQASVRKGPLALDADTAADRGKVTTDKTADSPAGDLELTVLRKKAADGDAEAITRLEALGRESVRKALRNPQNATSGQMAGFRHRRG